VFAAACTTNPPAALPVLRSMVTPQALIADRLEGSFTGL